jgi:hypothetical protein
MHYSHTIMLNDSYQPERDCVAEIGIIIGPTQPNRLCRNLIISSKFLLC